MESTRGGWSEWNSKPCGSGCLQKSKGIRYTHVAFNFLNELEKWFYDVIGAVESERECNNPKPSDVLHRCEGSSVKAAICDDVQLCGEKSRPTAAEFAGQQCVKFSKQMPFIDPKGTGMQAAYSDSMFKINLIISLIHILNFDFFFKRTAMAIVRHFL